MEQSASSFLETRKSKPTFCGGADGVKPNGTVLFPPSISGIQIAPPHLHVGKAAKASGRPLTSRQTRKEANLHTVPARGSQYPRSRPKTLYMNLSDPTRFPFVLTKV